MRRPAGGTDVTEHHISLDALVGHALDLQVGAVVAPAQIAAHRATEPAFRLRLVRRGVVADAMVSAAVGVAVAHGIVIDTHAEDIAPRAAEL